MKPKFELGQTVYIPTNINSVNDYYYDCMLKGKIVEITESIKTDIDGDVKNDYEYNIEIFNCLDYVKRHDYEIFATFEEAKKSLLDICGRQIKRHNNRLSKLNDVVNKLNNSHDMWAEDYEGDENE